MKKNDRKSVMCLGDQQYQHCKEVEAVAEPVPLVRRGNLFSRWFFRGGVAIFRLRIVRPTKRREGGQMTRAPNLEKLEIGPPPSSMSYDSLYCRPYVQTLQLYSTGPPLCSRRACELWYIFLLLFKLLLSIYATKKWKVQQQKKINKFFNNE